MRQSNDLGEKVNTKTADSGLRGYIFHQEEMMEIEDELTYGPEGDLSKFTSLRRLGKFGL